MKKLKVYFTTLKRNMSKVTNIFVLFISLRFLHLLLLAIKENWYKDDLTNISIILLPIYTNIVIGIISFTFLKNFLKKVSSFKEQGFKYWFLFCDIFIFVIVGMLFFFLFLLKIFWNIDLSVIASFTTLLFRAVVIGTVFSIFIGLTTAIIAEYHINKEKDIIELN